MSWRIEHADPLELMRELPSEWAQTCITIPPEDDIAATLAVLAQVNRVLRKDGTLWLPRPPVAALLRGLLEQGWLRRPLPVWSTPITGQTPLRALLLTKSPDYFCRPILASTTAAHRTRQLQASGCSVGCGGRDSRRAGLTERLILGSSAMLACGACGAPQRPTKPGDRQPRAPRTGCTHLGPHGRCLVIDPFYEPRTGTAELASRHGRSFLGITNHPTNRESS